MKMTKEIEEFINLTITEHMGKSYTDWKLKQQTEAKPDEVDEAYKKVIETLRRTAVVLLDVTVVVLNSFNRFCEKFKE